MRGTKSFLSYAYGMCCLWALLQKLIWSVKILLSGCAYILIYDLWLWLSTWGPAVGCFLPLCHVFANDNCSSFVLCRLLNLPAKAGFPMWLGSVFTLSLKRFLRPYSVRMPIFPGPPGNCFDKPAVSHSLYKTNLLKLNYHKYDFPTSVLPVLWALINADHFATYFKYGIQGRIARELDILSMTGLTRAQGSSRLCSLPGLSSQLEFQGRKQNWSCHSQAPLFPAVPPTYIF